MTDHWALIDNDNVVVEVHIASEDWIAAWNDPTGQLRYVPTEEGTGYASIEFTYDEPTGWFIPPASYYPEGWVFDRDPSVWAWVDPNGTDTPTAPD